MNRGIIRRFLKTAGILIILVATGVAAPLQRNLGEGLS